ncbi:MAG: carbon-nitrogen hydrolase family protein [Candidatus Thorarchaeota archaeon]|nr:MAG: carbon-nitrogen hydrolase family protein [Candidatus Thorarchaeota archaeon]
MERRLGVAGLQLEKDPFDSDINFKKLEYITRKVKSTFPWVDLVFTGELYLQQYGSSDWKEFAQPIPNDMTDRLSEIARDNECWFVPGSFLEKESDKIFNTALVYDPNGDIVAKYRKLYPWMPFEDTSYGTSFVTFDIPGVTRIGIVICYDLWFPEVFRTLAWMGAEVILQPSATYTPDRAAELVLTPAQAIMHQCYVLNSNVISAMGGGLSIFADPEGRILQQVGTHEEIMTEVIDLDRVDWIRQNGSFGITPVWKSLRDSPLRMKYPVYERFEEGAILKKLGEMKVQKSIREWTD